MRTREDNKDRLEGLSSSHVPDDTGEEVNEENSPLPDVEEDIGREDDIRPEGEEAGDEDIMDLEEREEREDGDSISYRNIMERLEALEDFKEKITLEE